MARGAGPAGPRQVFCYHCDHPLMVGAMAMSTNCPGCNKPIILEDIVVKSYKAVFNVETCGKLIVKKGGRVVAQKRIVAHAGIESDGVIQCKTAITGSHVRLGKKSEWRGDLRTPTLIVEPGAKIQTSHFSVPDDPLEHLKKNDQ